MAPLDFGVNLAMRRRGRLASEPSGNDWVRPVRFGSRVAAKAGSGHTRLRTTDGRCALVTGHLSDATGMVADERLLLH
jgi:hypothetical protein